MGGVPCPTVARFLPSAPIPPFKAWNELPSSVRNGGRPSKEEALLAVAVVNRIRRALADVSGTEGLGK
jgi:hypothetical protein